MSILVEDSPRANLAGWVIEAVNSDSSIGAVITPFATPWKNHRGPGKKKSAQTTSLKLLKGGVDVWFDPTTHALQMGGVGDFRFYDEYNLWGDQQGYLATSAAQEEHVRLVFEIQDQLGAKHLAPTILLHHGLSDTSQQALNLSKTAVSRDPNCWLSIAGTAPFWASGSALDAHIGALAQLSPSGWFLTVARPFTSVPAEADIEEVHGLCRTVRALSEYAQVHISHGDIAALPAVAAGATSVGSGWDKRQRVCSFSDYAPRAAETSGGGWYTRPTLKGLLGSLSSNELELLNRVDPDLVQRLGGMSPKAPKEAFFRHVSVLSEIIKEVSDRSSDRGRYQKLRDLYRSASVDWPKVQNATRSSFGGAEWIAPFEAGLLAYGNGEGW